MQVLVVVVVQDRRVGLVLDKALLRRARDKVAVRAARDAPVDLAVGDARLRGGEEVLLAGEGVEERVEPGGDEPAHVNSGRGVRGERLVGWVGG